MTDSQNAAIARAKVLLGDGYIYGATGWVCSPARRQQQAKQYPKWADMILKTGSKWDGIVCWDCAMFTLTVARAAGYEFPSGATSQYKEVEWKVKGCIDTIPSGVPVFLYRQSEGVMQHAGFALGDGTFIHSKGTAYGVIQQPMSAYAWTHWGSPWEIGAESKEDTTMENVLYQATVTAVSGNTVRVRKEPGGAVVGSLNVGTVVDVYNTVTGYSVIGFGGGRAYMQSAFLSRTAGDDIQKQIDELKARVEALEKK
ncbi:MAG TPA: NlpC/P60 family protein [Candidatus Limiplasma sp.]|nr:NlpC/P60 family protein [Candidatus Limiplasma sp.]